jgi:hypothetical protein
MLQNAVGEIIHCYERAQQAREKAKRAINEELRAESLAAEKRWMALAQSYERHSELTRTVAEFVRRRNLSAIGRMIQERGSAFDPEAISRMNVAYHAVLTELGLPDRQNSSTLMIARRIIELATLGERDPERMVTATVEFWSL